MKFLLAGMLNSNLSDQAPEWVRLGASLEALEHEIHLLGVVSGNKVLHWKPGSANGSFRSISVASEQSNWRAWLSRFGEQRRFTVEAWIVRLVHRHEIEVVHLFGSFSHVRETTLEKIVGAQALLVTDRDSRDSGFDPLATLSNGEPNHGKLSAYLESLDERRRRQRTRRDAMHQRSEPARRIPLSAVERDQNAKHAHAKPT